MSGTTANSDLPGDRIRVVTTAGVAGLAAGAFLLSYDALHQLARTSHVPAPLAWLWPLIVDGFILVASLAVLDAVHAGRPARYPWLLVLAFSALSVTFNVLHAPQHLVAQLVAAIPPLALVLSFELLMRQFHHQLKNDRAASGRQHHPARSPGQPAEPAAAPGTPAIAALQRPNLPRAEPPTVEPAPSTAKATRQPRAVTQARAEAVRADCGRIGQPLTTAVLAERLGISDGYARRLLRELNAGEGDGAQAVAPTVSGLRAVGP